MTPVKADGDITGELEQRKVQAERYNAAEREVIAQKGWIERLLPPPERGGLTAEAFCVQVLSLLRRSVRRDKPNAMTLMSAALANPDSLVFAMTDCAARNLIPGEEYWFVPFRDTQHGGPPVVTGMPGWKGELQQIYRSGMVEAVVCEVVYEGDHFKWLPTKMRVPEHEPADVSHDARFLRKVYAFAHLRGGGTTYPVVLGLHEIEIIESHSKAPRDFWQNPKWRHRMLLKSALHMLYDRVPHSAAYNTALVEAFAEAADRFPQLAIGGSDDDGADLTAGPAGAAAASGVQVPAAVPGKAERPVPPGAPGNGRPEPQTPSEPPAPPADGEAKASARTWNRLRARFARADLAGDEHGDLRLVIIGALASGHYREVTEESRLPEAEALYAIRQFDKLQADAEKAGQDLAGVLRGVHDRAVAGRDAAADEAEILSGEATGQAGEDGEPGE